MTHFYEGSHGTFPYTLSLLSDQSYQYMCAENETHFYEGSRGTFPYTQPSAQSYQAPQWGTAD